MEVVVALRGIATRSVVDAIRQKNAVNQYNGLSNNKVEKNGKTVKVKIIKVYKK